MNTNPTQGQEPRNTVTLAEFNRIELRVGTVLEASPHPRADKLVLLKVNMGTCVKQVVAGIRQYREPSTLVGRQVIVVDNLEPAVLRGERSEGMILAVLDGRNLALIAPDSKVSDGARVT